MARNSTALRGCHVLQHGWGAVVCAATRRGRVRCHAGIVLPDAGMPLLLAGESLAEPPSKAKRAACMSTALATWELWNRRMISLRAGVRIARDVGREVWPGVSTNITAPALLRWPPGAGACIAPSMPALRLASIIAHNAQQGGWELGECGQRARTARGIVTYQRWRRFSRALRTGIAEEMKR